MYYLKYRPKNLEELDNSQVREIILKILKTGNIPHAFLFAGPKGTGKTSTARILAKSVNCQQNKFSGVGKSIEPCGNCKNCKSIDSSASADVVELDAASNRGIEEVRKLIREASFVPMVSKFRIFIIDEAHMITSDAFNALLKTLEEPPPSIIFILATTNPEKIPKTILSRCFVVNFGRAKKTDLKRMFARIVSSESIAADDKLLNLIAKYANHSFRDAAKILEELVIQDKLSFGEAEKFLGILGRESLLEIIQLKSLKDALLWTQEFQQAGGNFKHLIEQLLDELRIQLLLKSGVAVTDEEVNLGLSLGEISHLIKLLCEAYNNLKITPIESIPLEIAIADFYNYRGK